MRSLSSKVPARRWLIVVADDQATLRQGLRLTFANDPSVEVVLDRRGAEPQVPTDEVTSQQRFPLSHEQDVMWRDLKFFLVDRWKGMTVTKPAPLKHRLGETDSRSRLITDDRADDPASGAGAGG